MCGVECLEVESQRIDAIDISFPFQFIDNSGNRERASNEDPLVVDLEQLL